MAIESDHLVIPHLGTQVDEYERVNGTKRYEYADGTTEVFDLTWPTPRLDRYGFRPHEQVDSVDRLKSYDRALAREYYSDTTRLKVIENYAKVLYPVFLPFSHLKTNTLEIMRLLGIYIQTRPKTSRSFKRRQLMSQQHLVEEYDLDIDTSKLTKRGNGTGGSDATGTTSAFFPIEGMLVHDAYPIDVNFGDNSYAVPGYVHQDNLPSIPDDDKTRRHWLLKYAALGKSLSEIQNHFGYDSKSGLKYLCRKYDINYGLRKRIGKAKLARTWATIHAWEPETTETDIAQGFGVSQSMVSDRIQEATETFEPPNDPTDPDDPPTT